MSEESRPIGDLTGVTGAEAQGRDLGMQRESLISWKDVGEVLLLKGLCINGGWDRRCKVEWKGGEGERREEKKVLGEYVDWNAVVRVRDVRCASRCDGGKVRKGWMGLRRGRTNRRTT